jgi:hypothetical protein
MDVREPESTKGKNTTHDDHADQVDHRSKRDLAVAINFDPTMTGEEDINSSPTKGWNKYTKPTADQTKSDRFTK